MMDLPTPVRVRSFGGTGGQLVLTCLVLFLTQPLPTSCLVCLLGKPFLQRWCKGKLSVGLCWRKDKFSTSGV